MISTILAAALALGGCASCGLGTESATAKAPVAAVHPVSGLPVIDLKVGRHAFRVEVAATQDEQAKGLMFRTAMGADEGMLFPEETPRRASFWMKNTVIPLDIIFVGTDGRIINIATALPYDETPVPAEGIAGAVLELNAGRSAELGIKAGDKVIYKLPKRRPES